MVNSAVKSSDGVADCVPSGASAISNTTSYAPRCRASGAARREVIKVASPPSSSRASWMARSTELAKYDLILMDAVSDPITPSSNPAERLHPDFGWHFAVRQYRDVRKRRFQKLFHEKPNRGTGEQHRR